MVLTKYKETIMQISETTDLSTLNGYYLVSKLSVRHCKESKAPYLHKCTPKTYATLSGAKRQLIEYKEDVSNLEELAEKAKLEEGINKAKMVRQ